jgi:hypothetical protein
MASILTRKAVADWFERHLLSTVGRVEEPDDCPLANFVKDNHPNFNDVNVDGHTLSYVNTRTNERRRVQLPKWARAFVNAIDSRDTHGGYEEIDYSYYETQEVWDDELEEYVLAEVYVEDIEYDEIIDAEVEGGEALQTLREVTRV